MDTPLHWGKLIMAGYNQKAVAVSGRIMKNFKVATEDWLTGYLYRGLEAA